MPDKKTKPLSPQTLARFNDFIGEQIGLNFSKNRWPELEHGIGKASKEFGFHDPEEGIHWLMSSSLSKKQIEILSTHLTIGETYFFREQETLDLLNTQVLPQLLQAAHGQPRPLRIWSAACSTGEEAYSIAILLDQKKKQLKGWDITLLATDINIKALEKAEAGIYSEWALRSTPGWIKHRYFTKNGKKSYEIKPHLKPMVQFRYLNLADGLYPSLLNNTNAMDIVFCRNVLMYFLPRKIKAVVNGFYRSLVPEGWLIVSPTDSFHFLELECFARSPLNPCLFNKCEKKAKTRTPTVEPLDLSYLPYREVPPVPVEERAEVNSGIEKYSDALRLYRQGNYPGTIDCLEDFLRGRNGIPTDQAREIQGDAYALIARSYANLGKLSEAVQWCRKAVESDKLNPAYHYLQVTIFQEQGDEEAALQSLKRCLYIDPDFLLAHFTLGNILSRRGDREEARKPLQIAISLLEPFGDEDVVSLEEGLTAGRLREILQTLLEIREGVVP
jgi:chemotaxis protein methyltransferase CheR